MQWERWVEACQHPFKKAYKMENQVGKLLC
jgi:hypothetical protein